MAAEIDPLRHQVCDVGRNMWRRGYCAGTDGNISARLDEDRVLCTPTGLSKGSLSPEDLCVVDMRGEQVEPNANGRRRTSEILVHTAIYRRRPDAGAVVHAHPPHVVAFCIAHRPLPRGVHPEAEMFLGPIIFADYATPGTPDVPASFADHMTEQTTSILLAHHGSVSFGRDLTEAYHRLEMLESYAQQVILARQLGGEKPLGEAQLAELDALKRRFNP